MRNIKKIISELCSIVGVEEWEEVLRTEHININKRTVGLIRSNDPKTSTNKLSVYVDLGKIHSSLSQKIHEKMLEANTKPGKNVPGCFAVHPTQQTAIYHIQNAEQMTGLELAKALSVVFHEIIPEYEKLVHQPQPLRAATGVGIGLGMDRRQAFTFTQSAK